MATATQPPPGLHLVDPNHDAEASTTTSPLSEVEDKDGLPDEMDGVVMTGEKHLIHDDDSDSNLSDAGNDTEAETERLYDTPQIQRHKTVVIDQYSRDHIVEKTPTRPGRTAKMSADSDLDDSYASDGIPVSPLPNVASKLANQKRKRSPDTDTSEAGQPLLKRSISATLNSKADAQTSMPRAPTLDARSENGSTNGTRGGREAANGVLAKDSQRQNGTKARVSIENHDHDDAGTEDDAEARSDHEGDLNEEAEAAARNEEEMEKKRIAIEEWAAIEARFSTFRDRLFKDRLDKLEKEEQSLLADEPYHPEYLAMKQCIDERFEKKMRHINKEYEYVLKAHEEVAVSTRTQIWSHFYQSMREKREEFLETLNQDWCETQNARRRAHSVPDVALFFPASAEQQTRNAIAYNTEVSILSGMAKHVGFPAVPPMHGASEAEIEDDFNAIKDVVYESETHNATSASVPAPMLSGGLAHYTAAPRATKAAPRSRARPRAQAAVPAPPAVSIANSMAPAAEGYANPSSALGNSGATITGHPPPRMHTGSRRTSHTKIKDAAGMHGTSSTTAPHPRIAGHTPGTVLPPPLRPSMDAARA